MTDSDANEYQFSGPHPHRDEDILRKLYHEDGLSLREVATILDTTGGTVYKWMQRLGVKTRTKKEAREGDGVSFITGDGGYEAFSVSEGTHSVLFRHHSLLAIAAGADPADVFSDGDYHVHHINGVPWDNRVENLAVVPASDHIREHELPSQFHGPYIRDEEGYWKQED